MISKEKIIEKCLNLIKSKVDFNKEADKFKKKHPSSYIHDNFSEDIKGKIFLYCEELYIPKRIVIERDNPPIECSKYKLFGWSASSLNKITMERFENFKELNKIEVKEFCNKLLRKHVEGIIKLEDNVLKEFAKQDGDKVNE